MAFAWEKGNTLLTSHLKPWYYSWNNVLHSPSAFFPLFFLIITDILLFFTNIGLNLLDPDSRKMRKDVVGNTAHSVLQNTIYVISRQILMRTQEYLLQNCKQSWNAINDSL